MPCSGCKNGQALDFEISMAFQPIVDLNSGLPFAYEALVRGPDGESAESVLSQMTPQNRYAFDQRCRVMAIEKAAAAGLLNTPAKLSINFLPNAVYSPRACIQLTLETAKANDVPTDRFIFEFTEQERMPDTAHIRNIVKEYRAMGLATAIDDFGAGHAGLGLLARFQPDIVKLDMELIRDIDTSLPRRIIVGSVVRMCAELGVTIIAEGVETEAELEAIRGLGICYVQGFLIAKPKFEALPPLALTSVHASAAA